MKILSLIWFTIALLFCGIYGTGSRLLFMWPDYFMLGLAGVVSVVTWSERPRFAPSDLCLLTALMFVAYISARALTSPVVYMARIDLFLVLACGLFYGFTALHFASSKERLGLFLVFVVITVGNLIVGSIHFAGHPEFSIVPGFSRTYPAGRIGGFFNNPNHLGAFLGFMSLATLSYAAYGRGGSARKLLLLFLAGLMALGLALTVSRGAVVGLAAGLVVFAALSLYLLRHLHRQLFGKLMLLLGIGLVVAVGVIAAVSLVFLKQRVHADSVFQESARTHFWKAGLDQWAASPLFGAGSQAYYWLNRLYRPDELVYAVGEVQYAHNEYVQMLADYGIVGLLVLVLAVGLHYWNGLKFVRWFCREKFPRSGNTTSTQLGLVVGVLSGLSALLVHAMFDFHFHIGTVAILAAFGFGILANPGFESSDGRRVSGIRVPFMRPVIRSLMVVVGAVMVYCGFNFGRSELYLERGRRIEEPQLNFDNVSFFARAAELDPKNPLIYAESGRAWARRVRLGMPDAVARSFLGKAREEYEKAFELYPQDIYTTVSLGNCLDGLGFHEKAEEKFLTGLKWAPKFQFTRLAYAIHLQRLKKWDEAAEAYQVAIKGHPLENVELNYNRVLALIATLEEERKKDEEARRESEPVGSASP